VPIAWDELGPKLTSEQFTVKTVPARLARLGADPWAGYWKNRQTVRPDVARLLVPQQDP
jgi:bifunctional non-homologous end joining protein LigD